MSEKRFKLDYEEDDAIFIVEDDDIVYPIRNDTIKEFELQKLVDKLNEQQELIEELQVSDEMGWKRAERFEKKCPKELHNKNMYIKRLEYKVQKFKEINGEQQATINELQSIINHIKCEENCEDYDYCCETVNSLYDEIKHLKEENEQLRKQLDFYLLDEFEWKEKYGD